MSHCRPKALANRDVFLGDGLLLGITKYGISKDTMLFMGAHF